MLFFVLDILLLLRRRHNYPHRGSAGGQILGRSRQRNNREAGPILAWDAPCERIQERRSGSGSDHGKRESVRLSSVMMGDEVGS